MELEAMKKEARNYKLMNVDTGEEIRHAFWANDETGDYKIYSNDGQNRIRGIDGIHPDEIICHGNIKFVKKECL